MDQVLKDYNIVKDASISLVACLNGGAKGGGEYLASNPLSFKDALSGCSICRNFKPYSRELHLDLL